MSVLRRLAAIVIATAIVIGGTIAFVNAGGVSLLPAAGPGAGGEHREGLGQRPEPAAGLEQGESGTAGGVAPGASPPARGEGEGGRGGGRGEGGHDRSGNTTELVSAAIRMLVIGGVVILLNVAWRSIARRRRSRGRQAAPAAG